MEFAAVLRVDMTPLPPFLSQYSGRVVLTGTGKLYAGSAALAALASKDGVGSLTEGVDFESVADFNASYIWRVAEAEDQGDRVVETIRTVRTGDVVKLGLALTFYMTEKKRKQPCFNITSIEVTPRAQVGNRR